MGEIHQSSERKGNQLPAAARALEAVRDARVVVESMRANPDRNSIISGVARLEKLLTTAAETLGESAHKFVVETGAPTPSASRRVELPR